jgi:hypothetical protein
VTEKSTLGLLLCLLTALPSCGGDPNAANAGCEDAVSVGVGTGLTPKIIWLPNCAVYNLVVLEGVGPHSFEQQNGTWAVESQPDSYGVPNNRLYSGIRYGEVPQDGRQVIAPAPLVAGQAYTVYLNVYTLNQRVENVGWRTFTP